MKSLFQIQCLLKFDFSPKSYPSDIEHTKTHLLMSPHLHSITMPPFQGVHFICLFIYLHLAMVFLKGGRLVLESHRT